MGKTENKPKNAALQTLSEALDQPVDALGFLDVLSAKAKQQLDTDIEAARKAHKQEIITSLNKALDHVPRLLRGPIRKIFGV